MKNLASKAGHRHHRMLLLLLSLFSTCDALVTIDEAAEAREHMLTFERVAQATTLLLAAYNGWAVTDGLRKNGVIGLVAGLYEDRRSTLTFVDDPSRRPSRMGASPHSGVQAYFPKKFLNFGQHFLEICHANPPRSGVDLHHIHMERAPHRFFFRKKVEVAKSHSFPI